MAKKKNSAKKTARSVEKAIRKSKHPVLWTVALLLIVAIVLGVWYFCVYKKNQTPKIGSIKTGEMAIHFMELGNKYAGDSIYIQIGDIDILVDSGSRQSSAKTTGDYIAQYCKDGVLEYVIATHADQDHIAGFVGTKSEKGIFERFECKTIIDFPLTDKRTEVYQNYVAAREKEVEAGATHYTALECWKEEKGAKRIYELAEGVSLHILYNKFYEERSADENNYSVCFLLKQGDYNYLFTGDLEKEGEEALVKNNDLPQCKLFKAGHHGSKTSSTEALLSVIRPEYVCICCCAGAPEYTTNVDNIFPTKDALKRIEKYTENIYVTSLATKVNVPEKEWEYTSMNGNIVFISDGIDCRVECSNSTAPLKDTEWYKENRA